MKTLIYLTLTSMLPLGLQAAVPAPRVSGMPFFFVENRGLTDPRAHYFLKRTELSAWFLEGEILLATRGHRVSMRFAGANLEARIEGADPMEGRANFFLGNESGKWVKDLQLEGAVAYRELWPGIDMVYAGNGRTLKSEFRVAKGGDPAHIRWSYGEPFHAQLSADGSLSVSGEGLDLREDAPVIYQEKNGARVVVTGKFRTFSDGSVGFELGAYDRELPLVIDPTMTFSTYIGGNGQDEATAVALDGNGNAYLAGWTDSTNFAQTGPAKWKSYSGSMDVFVAKFSALGDKLMYCTYLGGTGDDRATGLAVDTAGTAYVTGYTTSTNFPLSSAPIQSRMAGKRNAFVSHLNAAGNGMLYSTYLGGEGTDGANGIAVDTTGHAYIAGDTNSIHFPTTSGSFQTVAKGGEEGFVAEVNPAGTALVFSTYLGGSLDEHIAGIAVFSYSGAIAVTGSTYSTDFPVVNSAQPVSGGNQDAFVTGLAAGGRTLFFSTYLGGSGGTAGLPEEGDAIAFDVSGFILVAGTTSSLNFPVSTTGQQQTFGGGNTDGFVVKYDPTGRFNFYGTYIGGSSVEHVTGVTTDPRGYIYVAGYTASQDFPNIRAVQKSNQGSYDGFLYKLTNTGEMVFSTYLGGGSSDAITSIAVDMFGNAVLGGYTSSSDFPVGGVLGSAQKYKYGTITAFLTKVSMGWTPAVVDTINGALNFTIDQAHDRGTDGVNGTSMKAAFGLAGDQPVIGDWNGSGTPKIGYVRNGVWYLDYNGNGLWDGPSGGDRQFTFPLTGIPLVGDWDGSGFIKAGVFNNGYWVFDMSGMIQGTNNGKPLKTFFFGSPGDTPVVGDWTGNGVTKVGIVHKLAWSLDINGDYNFDFVHDRIFNFGIGGDIPIAGDWDGSGIARPGVYRNGTWFLSFDPVPPAGTYIYYPYNAWTFSFGSALSTPIITN